VSCNVGDGRTSCVRPIEFAAVERRSGCNVAWLRLDVAALGRACVPKEHGSGESCGATVSEAQGNVTARPSAVQV
jgi:hypothetical protein